MRISHAQNGEDMMLHRLFDGQATGFYIDVGAGDPDALSVTRFFYDLGWRGINIDPNPVRAEALRQVRPRDVTVAAGLADRRGTLTFLEASNPDYSTFRPEYAEIGRKNGIAFAERPVNVMTLADVCALHAPEKIDFLSIDAEGFERQIISGGDWRRWRPRAILLEAIRPGDWGRSDIGRIIPVHDEWEPLLLAADYRFAFFDGLNRFYLRAEDEGLLPRLAFPASSVVDGFVTAEQARMRIDMETMKRELADVYDLDPLAVDFASRLKAASFKRRAASTGFRRLMGRSAR